MTSLTEAIRLVEETHGRCSTQEISEFLHDSALITGSKFFLDLDLFEYLAEQTEPQPIVQLAEDLTRSLLTHLSKSPVLLENRAIVKVFLNFELMAERLLLMMSDLVFLKQQGDFHFKYLQRVAVSKHLCVKGIQSSSNPFLFRYSLEVSRLTICHRVRIYSKNFGEEVFESAFPSDPVIQEYVMGMWAFKDSSIGIEPSSNVQRLLTYLQLGDVLNDAVGKDYIAMPFIIWLNTLCSGISSGLPEFYQIIIYKDVTEASPKFLLTYVETAFPEKTLVEYYSKESSNSSIDVAKHLETLPTLRLKYLFLKSVFLRLFNPPLSQHPVTSIELRERIGKAISFEVYGSDQCLMRRFLFGNEKEHLIILGVLNLSNDEEKPQLKAFRDTIREEMSPELKEFLAIPQAYEYLFMHFEVIHYSLLVTFDTIKPFQADFLSMRKKVFENSSHVFPNYEEKLIKSKETNKLDLDYLEQVSLGSFHKLLGCILDHDNTSSNGSIFPGSLRFINEPSCPNTLFQETMPTNSSLKCNARLQNRLLFVVQSMGENVICSQLSDRENAHLERTPYEKITDPVELLVHLEAFTNENLNSQEDIYSLIQKLPCDSSKRQHVLEAYIVILESRGINPYITLRQYISKCNEPEPQTRGLDLWNYAIQQLFVLLKEQYNFPSEDHESQILNMLRVLYHEVEENEYWERTKNLMKSIQELAVEVGLFNFSPEGLGKLVDTLDINLHNVMNPTRNLTLDRRKVLMASPLFSAEFKTFLIQNVCLNALSTTEAVKFMPLHSKSFIAANNSNIAVISLVNRTMREQFHGVPEGHQAMYPTLEKFISSYLTKTNFNLKKKDMDDALDLINEAISTLEIGIINGLASKEVREYVASAFAYALAANELPVGTFYLKHGLINVSPRMDLLRERKSAHSWRILVEMTKASIKESNVNPLEPCKASIISLMDSVFTVLKTLSEDPKAMKQHPTIAKTTASNNSKATKKSRTQKQVGKAKISSHLNAPKKEENVKTITNSSATTQKDEKLTETGSLNPTRPSRTLMKTNNRNKNTSKNKQKTSDEKSKAGNYLVEEIARPQIEKSDTSADNHLEALNPNLREETNQVSNDSSHSKTDLVDLVDRKAPFSFQKCNSKRRSVKPRSLRTPLEKVEDTKKPAVANLIPKGNGISSQIIQNTEKASESNNLTLQNKPQAPKGRYQAKTETRPDNIGKKSSDTTEAKNANFVRKGTNLPNHSKVSRTLSKSSYASALNHNLKTQQAKVPETKSTARKPVVNPPVEAQQTKPIISSQPTYRQTNADMNVTEQPKEGKKKSTIAKSTYKPINDPLMTLATQSRSSNEPLRESTKEIPSELLKVGMKQPMPVTELCCPKAPRLDDKSHSWPVDIEIPERMLEFMFTPSQSSLFSFSPIHYVYRFDQQTIVDRYFSPNPSLNSEIFTLDRLNAKDLDVLLLLLQHATTVAIDFEMTGVKAKNGGSTVEGVKEHKVFQMGLCIVKKQDGVDYVSTWRINACDNGQLQEHMFNKESVEFLKKSFGKNFVKDLRPTLLDYSTLRAIFNEIQARNVPVIVHNGYADLLHVSKIMGEDISGITFDNFIPFFCSVYDSKYLCKELNEVYKGKSMTGSIIWDTKLENLMAIFYPVMVKPEEKKMHDGAYDALATYLVYSEVNKRLQALQFNYQSIPGMLFKMIHF